MISVVLVINGQTIPERALTEELLRLSGGLEADSPHAAALPHDALRSAAVGNVVRRTLLCQAAIAEGLRVHEDEAWVPGRGAGGLRGPGRTRRAGAGGAAEPTPSAASA